jgi:hypothetical protein
MNKTAKILLLFLLFDLLVLGGYLAYKKMTTERTGGGTQKYEWTIVDENYVPRNYIEEYLKNDAAAKGIFPVSLRNYGKDASILKKFKGSNFAGPSEAVLNMSFKGLEDWMLVDVKYKNEKNREIQRTILYVYLEGAWRVGDSGQLMK